MCGIFGIVGVRGVRVSAALPAMHHRGPDGSGEWTSGDVTLSHTRLAIIDLSEGGRQPMASADGRYVVVFNGEIYNYRELRADLVRDGLSFVSDSDTEVLLQAYTRWGAGAVSRMRGMFAFAIWDTTTRTLFCARDRLGVKPFYWCEPEGGGFAFASEIRTLLATGCVAPRLSLAGLHGYLATGSSVGNAPLLEGTRELLPGHTLTWRNGKATVDTYWEIPFVSQGGERPDPEEMHHIWCDAVRYRLVADVPVGVFLSGGIDSSSIVATASEQQSQPLRTFTVVLEEVALNEADHASAIARAFGCEHRAIPLSAVRALKEIEDAFSAQDLPSFDGVNTYFVAKAVREAGIRVALSGLGGDEVFAGYQRFRQFGSLLRSSGVAPGLAHSALAMLPSFGPIPNALRQSAAVAASTSAAEVYAACRACFLPEQRHSLLARRLRQAPSDHAVWTPKSWTNAAALEDPINAYSTLELGNYLRDTLLRDADVMSMAHGLEIRLPLMDHVLIERLARVRGREKLPLRGESNKPLLVRAVGDLPRSAVHRPKQGFALPFRAWLHGPLRPWAEEVLDEGSRLGMFDPAGVRRAWSAFLSGERRVSHARVVALLSIVQWCKRLKIEIAEP